MKKCIYTITSLFLELDKEKSKLNKKSIKHLNWKQYRDRIVGYYFDLDAADQCVTEDRGGFSEAGFYNYIVIEKVNVGLYNIPKNKFDSQFEWWYRHNDKRNKWERCKKPMLVNHVINFGIG